jgi:hypothetical protein
MPVRRVVTGVADGAATIISDGPAPRDRDFTTIPQMNQTVIWMTEPGEKIADSTEDRSATASSILPGPGGTTLVMVTFPPGSVFASPDFDGAAAAAENLDIAPGLAERFEPDGSGRHTTDTIDYGVVLEGELWLELENGVETKLERHDVVVQRGTRHAWSVRTEQPAKALFVLMGHERA